MRLLILAALLASQPQTFALKKYMPSEGGQHKLVFHINGSESEARVEYWVEGTEAMCQYLSIQDARERYAAYKSEGFTLCN